MRESLLASVSETWKARSMAKRSDARLITTSTSLLIPSEGGRPSAAVTWTTPTEFPPMLTGIHSAEQARPRQIGASIDGRTLREDHRLPSRGGRAVVGRDHRASGLLRCGRRHQYLSEVSLARVGEEQLGSHVRGSVAQGLGHQIEDRFFGLGHFQRPLQLTFEFVAPGRQGLDDVTTGHVALQPQGLPGQDGGGRDPEGAADDEAQHQAVPGIAGVGLDLVGGPHQETGDGRLQRRETIVQVLIRGLFGRRHLCALSRSRPCGQ